MTSRVAGSLTLVVLGLLAVAGCGGKSAEEVGREFTEAVADGDGAAACELMTARGQVEAVRSQAQILKTVGGLGPNTCADAMGFMRSYPDDDAFTFEKVDVDGDEATLTLKWGPETETVEMLDTDEGWRVSKAIESSVADATGAAAADDCVERWNDDPRNSYAWDELQELAVSEGGDLDVQVQPLPEASRCIVSVRASTRFLLFVSDGDEFPFVPWYSGSAGDASFAEGSNAVVQPGGQLAVRPSPADRLPPSGAADESGKTTIEVGDTKRELDETFGEGQQPGHGAGCIYTTGEGDMFALFKDEDAPGLDCPSLTDEATVIEVFPAE